jgi:hypothetical protein
MLEYIHNIEMPFCGKNINFRELTNLEQIYISKANIVMPPENKEPELYSSYFKNIVFNCVQNKEVLKELNLIEYILFITKLRMTCFGSDIELSYNQENENDEYKNVKINIELQSFMQNLYNGSSCLERNPITINNIEIVLNWPLQTSENYFLKLDSDVNSVISSLPEFVSEIRIKDKIIKMLDYSIEQKQDIFNNLPVAVRTRIQNEILKSLQTLSTQDLFGIKHLSNYKFSFFNKLYQDIIRLFFSFDLRGLYREYYILASKRIPPFYLDNKTSTDKKIYLSILEEEMASRESSDINSGGTPLGGTPLENLAREFGDELPN